MTSGKSDFMSYALEILISVLSNTVVLAQTKPSYKGIRYNIAAMS